MTLQFGICTMHAGCTAHSPCLDQAVVMRNRSTYQQHDDGKSEAAHADWYALLECWLSTIRTWTATPDNLPSDRSNICLYMQYCHRRRILPGYSLTLYQLMLRRGRLRNETVTADLSRPRVPMRASLRHVDDLGYRTTLHSRSFVV
jgi:hypothetical protein